MQPNEACFLNPPLDHCFCCVGLASSSSFSAKRDLANKRRELRVKYLIDAYRQLERASNRTATGGQSSRLESAIADIQLLGTPKQVEMAKRFAIDFAQNRTASLDELLFDLRATLRAELDLEIVESQIQFLRIYD